MAIEAIAAESRHEIGSGPSGRLRRRGMVPAVIYGHGKAAEPLAIDRKVIEKVVGAHHRMVDVQTDGGGPRRAFIREVQYNAINDEVIHVDLVEVSEKDRLELTVPLVFRGEAAGIKEGGVIEINMHEVDIECAADAIVDEITVNLAPVHLGQTVHVADLEVPEGISVVSDAKYVVVMCRRPREVVEEEAVPAEGAEAAPAQPEVIAEKKREEREQKKDEE